jgi:hypothetical protein
LNEQDEHGGEQEKRLEQGATFPPFFPLSFFFLFLFFFPPSPPFRGDLKVFHQHDLKALLFIDQPPKNNGQLLVGICPQTYNVAEFCKGKSLKMLVTF